MPGQLQPDTGIANPAREALSADMGRRVLRGCLTTPGDREYIAPCEKLHAIAPSDRHEARGLQRSSISRPTSSRVSS